MSKRATYQLVVVVVDAMPADMALVIMIGTKILNVAGSSPG